MKRMNFLIGMTSLMLVLGMAGCDSAASGAAQKVLQGMTSYTIVLGSVVSGSSYTAVVYDDTEAVGSGEALAENGSASIRLTPYNGKPAFSERPYRVKVSSGTAVRESDSVDFVAGGNTHVDWGTMTVISGEQDGEDNGKEMSSYTIVLVDLYLPYAAYDDTTSTATYTAVAYAGGEAIGGGVAKAENGSASIRLTPYNGKSAFSERTYRVQISSSTAVKEALVPFVAGGNTPLSWGAMTVIPEGSRVSAYSIVLSEDKAYVFKSADAKLALLVVNTGDEATDVLTVELIGDSDAFTLSKTKLPSIKTGKSDTLVIAPVAGLDAGTYEAGVVLSGEKGVAATLDVSFTVVIVKQGVLTVTGAGDGIQYKADVYKYSKAVTDAAEMKDIISDADLAGTGVGVADDGTLEISLITLYGEDFTSDGKFLVVLTSTDDDASAPLKYKAAVTFIGGSATLKYSALKTAAVETSGTDDPSEPSEPSAPEGGWTSLAPALAYLSAHSGGSNADNPVLLKLNVNLASATDGWYPLVVAIRDSGKYVALDLSGSTVINGEFDSGIYGADMVQAKIVSLVLPDSATSISGGSTALSSGVYAQLKTVSGANITTIGTHALYNCGALTTVSFPEATSIGTYAFFECRSLATASFPEATNIGNYAFSRCTSLSAVSFPKATTIGEEAFGNANLYPAGVALTSVSFPEATSIGYNAFHSCTTLITASFPKATTIGNNAFYGTALTTVSFPEATSIGYGAFIGCTALTTVSFPKATSIGDSVFWSCTSLTTVSIPKATSIGYQAFHSSGRGALTITMGTAAPTVGSNTFYEINGSKTVTIRVPSGATGYDATWQNAFKGGNSYINLVMEYY